MDKSYYSKLLCKLQTSNTKTVRAVICEMKSPAFKKCNGSSAMIKIGGLGAMVNRMSMSHSCKNQIHDNDNHKDNSNKHRCDHQCDLCDVTGKLLSVAADWCVEDEKARKIFMDENTITKILNILEGESSAIVKERAARLVSNVTITKAALPFLARTDILRIMVKLLDETTRKYNQIINAKLIGQLCQNDSERERLVNLGGIFTLSKLLLSENDDVVTRVLRTLCQLASATCSPGFASQIVRGGVIKDIILWCKSENEERFCNALTLFLNLTAQEESRVAIGNHGGIDCLMEILKATCSRGYRWDKVANGLCFLCKEAVNRVRLRDSGFLQIVVEYLEQDRYSLMHSRLLSAVTMFHYDSKSMDELSTERFVGVLLRHLQRAPMFRTSVFETLELSQMFLDIFTSRGSVEVVEVCTTSRKRCRSDRDDKDYNDNDNDDDAVAPSDRLPGKRPKLVYNSSLDTKKCCKCDIGTKLSVSDKYTFKSLSIYSSDSQECYSTVQSCEKSDSAVNADSSRASGGSLSDRESPIFRVNSPSYQAQIEKNREYDELFAPKSVTKYGPLTRAYCLSPVNSEVTPKYRYSPCNSYGPVASPLSYLGGESPVSSFQSSVICEYSSEDEECSDLDDKSIDKNSDILRYINHCEEIFLNGTYSTGDTASTYKAQMVESNSKDGLITCDATHNCRPCNFTETKNDVDTRNKEATKESKSLNPETESNIVAILMALSYNPNNACLVTNDHIRVLVDYVAYKPKNSKIVKILARLIRDKYFEELISLEMPRLIVSRLLRYRYTSKQSSEPRATSMVSTTHSCSDDRGGSGNLTFETSSEAGWILLKALHTAAGEWYGFGTLERMLIMGDSTTQLRMAIGILYVCGDSDAVCKLLIQNRVLYSLLSMLRTNDVNETTMTLVSGIHFLARMLAGDINVSGGDDLPKRREFPRARGEVSGDSFIKDVDCQYSQRKHDVTLSIHDRKYGCERGVISRSNPVFGAMLHDGFKESYSDCIHLTPLSHTNHISFSIILHYLHGCSDTCHVISSLIKANDERDDPTGTSRDENDTSRKRLLRTCLGVAQWADYYSIRELAEYANSVIWNECISISTLRDLQDYAVQQCDNDLAIRCVECLLLCDGDVNERVTVLLSLIDTHGPTMIDVILSIIESWCK